MHFRDRLEVDYPTTPVAELLLEKLQIVKFTEKDLKDSVMLTKEQDIGKGDSSTINSEYIATLLSKDWGFYFTETTRTCMLLKKETVRDVKSKTDKLFAAIERKPTSLAWKLRAKSGTRVKWYNEVEEGEKRDITPLAKTPILHGWSI